MLNKRKLFGQFFGVHIIILFLAVGFVALYTWYEGRKTFESQWLAELSMQAELAVAVLEGPDSRLVDREDCERLFARLARLDRHRFTLILPDGAVIGDNKATIETMDSHRLRPEVQQAREKGEGFAQRYSTTLGRPMLYVARRVPADLQMAEEAVLRVSVTMTTLSGQIRAANRQMAVLVFVILAATLCLSYLAALRIIGPVSDLQSGLMRIGGGDLSFRLRVPSVPHLTELARSINQTADRLELHIGELQEERNLRTLILKNMDLGLIAVDREQRIMNMNEAALALLNIRVKNMENSKAGEVIRYPELLNFLDVSEQTDLTSEAVISIADADESGDERILALRALAFNDLHGKRIGTLVILSDITRIRKLETVRQDFVANVSHELRTPVTSIKGFSETLLDGALEDPAAARHFVGIIARQAGHLEQIISDLLSLSRLEQNIYKQPGCVTTPVEGILKNAAEICQRKIDEMGIDFHLQCQKAICIECHPGLIEQAFVNLIDNAIKYGCNETSRRIVVSALREGGTVKIEVRDFGTGIEKRHLSRMFERFYRVDRGRSREVGGTGLGLAIVKHIVLIHQGTVNVESELGHGSTFTITLPAQRKA